MPPGIPGGRVSAPGSGLLQDVGELFAPLLLHIQRQGIGEELLKEFGGLFRRVQLVEPFHFRTLKERISRTGH